jgi:hypothetical protein
MHKTVISSESLLVKVLRRAKELAMSGKDVYATPALNFFLYNDIGLSDQGSKGSFPAETIAANFTRLDDSDIFTSAKYWSDHSDRVLADLSGRLIRRDLLAIELQNEPFSQEKVNRLMELTMKSGNLTARLAEYYVFTGTISNLMYAPYTPEVRILLKNRTTAEFTSVSDMFDHRLLSERVTKYYLCYPKECV